VFSHRNCILFAKRCFLRRTVFETSSKWTYLCPFSVYNDMERFPWRWECLYVCFEVACCHQKKWEGCNLHSVRASSILLLAILLHSDNLLKMEKWLDGVQSVIDWAQAQLNSYSNTVMKFLSYYYYLFIYYCYVFRPPQMEKQGVILRENSRKVTSSIHYFTWIFT